MKKFVQILIICILACQLSGCAVKDKIIADSKEYIGIKLKELNEDEEFIEEFNNVCDKCANKFIEIVFKERPAGGNNE